MKLLAVIAPRPSISAKAVFCLLILRVFALPTLAQNAALQGTVTDQSGAIVPGATVSLTDSSGGQYTVQSKPNGTYSVSNLATGTYSVQAWAPNMALAQSISLMLKPGLQKLNLILKVQAAAENVRVEGESSGAVSTEASNNASATVLRGEDLQALADNPDDLAQDLEALAGPSAGPNGGALYVDGFSGGELPPKNSIREIRVNQNPFSPEYDKLGYGRIEIFTKPGTDKFRGTAFFNLGDSVWNSRDPYAQKKAPFLLREYGGNVGGPIGKPASLLFDTQGAAIDNGAIINAVTLDPQTLVIIDPFTSVFSVPQRRIIITPRVDYQLNGNNTLTLRYRAEQANIEDSGIGSLNLLSLSNRVHSLSHTVQATETVVMGSAIVNETRFQFYRVGTSTVPKSAGPEIQALGAFNGGGSQLGLCATHKTITRCKTTRRSRTEPTPYITACACAQRDRAEFVAAGFCRHIHLRRRYRS